MKLLKLISLLFFFFSFPLISSSLNSDGILLMSFKYSLLLDPFNSSLQTWNYDRETPCSWHGVLCNNASQVISLSLSNSHLLGSFPSNLDLTLLQNLQTLNLSNNSLNGSLPIKFFTSRNLRFLDLSNNLFSGEIPATIGELHSLQTLNLSNNLFSGEIPTTIGDLRSLQILNLSDNVLAGKLPPNLVQIENLTEISLKNNYFSGEIPGGWRNLQFLDISSNLFNGSLPENIAGESLRYLNLSYNQISGEIPSDFISINTTTIIDLSFNNLTGPIPVYLNRKSISISGNPDLCGYPTRKPCPISSSPVTITTPAIAAIPKTIGSNPVNDKPETTNSTGLKPGVITGIIIGDIAGITLLAVIFFYIYKYKKNKSVEKSNSEEIKDTTYLSPSSSSNTSSSSPVQSNRFGNWSCLRRTQETTPSDEEEEEDEESQSQRNKKGTLVIIDGEKEIEVETLLKASAYILGATGSSIMYKTVLEDGTVLAVRRLGENGLNQHRFKDFEAHIRAIGKMVHPNLVRLRGFYWGIDEKLIIYDFVPNGSLVNARYRKGGSSPCHLPWESRLKIAKGLARGLAYLHEKKHVHGNLKPSNILLGQGMEPKIGDFGLEWLLAGDTSYNRAGVSSRIFSSKRLTTSTREFGSIGPTPSPSPSSVGPISPYCAPESLRNLKPSPKWDVFGFGVILLELLTGKIVSADEVGHGNGLTVEDGNRALIMADVAIRGELEGKEDFLLSLFKLGYSCASHVPQKRPTMKEALVVFDRFPSSSSTAKSPLYQYGHY